MGLFDIFRPKHLHPDPDVRLSAVGRLTSIDHLVEMVKSDTDKRVRFAALQKVKDEIVSRISSWDLRAAVMW